MPDTISIELRNLLKAYGAELVLTKGNEGMKGAIRAAEELSARTPNSFIPHPRVRVTRLVDDGELLPVRGGLTVIHTPGHTPGHICLYRGVCRQPEPAHRGNRRGGESVQGQHGQWQYRRPDPGNGFNVNLLKGGKHHGVASGYDVSELFVHNQAILNRLKVVGKLV